MRETPGQKAEVGSLEQVVEAPAVRLRTIEDAWALTPLTSNDGAASDLMPMPPLDQWTS